jgi:chromosome segregation ATPase
LKVEQDNLQSKLTKQRNLNLKMEENFKRSSANFKSAELEIAALKRHVESEKKISEKLSRDKDAVTKALIDLEEVNMKLNMEIHVYEQTNRKMQATVDEMTETANERKRLIKQLETEKDRYITDVQELTYKVNLSYLNINFIVK